MIKQHPLATSTLFINRFRCRDSSLNEEDYKIATEQFNIIVTANLCMKLTPDERVIFYEKIKDVYFLYTLGSDLHLPQSPEDWLEKVKIAVSAKERITFSSTSTDSPSQSMVLVNEDDYKETIRKRDEAEKESKEKDCIISQQQKTIARLNGDIAFKKECADMLYYAIEKIANPSYPADLYTLCERIMDIPSMADELHKDDMHLILNIAGILIDEKVVKESTANQISRNICNNTNGAKYVYFYKKSNQNYQRTSKYQVDQVHYLCQLYKDNRLQSGALSQE